MAVDRATPSCATALVLTLLYVMGDFPPGISSLIADERSSPTPLTSLGQGLIRHWKLAEDARDSAGSGETAIVHGDVDFESSGPHGKEHSAARFDGQGDFLEIAPTGDLQLGTGDFSVACWVNVPTQSGDVPGDILSWYDPAHRRGFHLTIKTQSVTTSVANDRQLQFGIDDDRTGEWIDCGRPGEALLAFALTEHQGELYAGTCEPGAGQVGRVYRFAGGQKWIDCGSPDGSNAVTSLAVFDGDLYAGTGKYRVSGSALPESENTTLGGRIFRYAGDQHWVPCGVLPDTEAIGGLVVYKGHLYASSLYRPAGFYRYEGETRWTNCGTPEGTRVVALGIHDGFLYGTSYDRGHVYRYDGEHWTDCGLLGENTQTYSFATYQGDWYVGTWPSGRVYRFDDLHRWTDAGRLGEELEVMGMLVHNGRLIAGTLPLAEVHQYAGNALWHKLFRLDHTPDVKYRRAWTMAEHGGRVYCSTLPSGHVYSFAAGTSVMHGHSFPAGWHHVTAIRSASGLSLSIDGKQVAMSQPLTGPAWNLDVQAPFFIGRGSHSTFLGELADVRLYRRVLSDVEIRQLSTSPPE